MKREEIREIQERFRQAFGQNKNVFTPSVIQYGEKNGFFYEISKGEDKDNKAIYGLTVIDEDNINIPEMGNLFFSMAAMQNVIKLFPDQDKDVEMYYKGACHTGINEKFDQMYFDARGKEIGKNNGADISEATRVWAVTPNGRNLLSEKYQKKSIKDLFDMFPSQKARNNFDQLVEIAKAYRSCHKASKGLLVLTPHTEGFEDLSKKAQEAVNKLHGNNGDSIVQFLKPLFSHMKDDSIEDNINNNRYSFWGDFKKSEIEGALNGFNSYLEALSSESTPIKSTMEKETKGESVPNPHKI